MFSSTLILSLSALLAIAVRAKDGSSYIDIRDVLPGGYDVFDNYDVLNVEERDDEDVVYITPRADEDSCDDCFNYSTWPWPADVKAEIAEESSSGTTVKRSNLHTLDESDSSFDLELVDRASGTPGKGNAKKAEACAGVDIGDGKTIDKITFFSYAYPQNEGLMTQYKSEVFDFEKWDDPVSAGYYNIKDVKELKVTVNGAPKNRKVSVEHILEWQLLKKFIESDKSKGKDSICAHVKKFFTTKVAIDTKWSVKDDNGKGAAKDVPVKKDEEQGIDWVAHQYPGVKSESPFTYEFVHLNNDVNGLKKTLWAGNKITPDLNGNEEVKKNSETMDWHLENKWYDKKKFASVQKYKENQGKCKAIKKLRDVVGMYEYHRDKRVSEIIIAQYTRIATAFQYLENEVLPKIEFKNDKGAKIEFKSMNLKDKWLGWMKANFDSNIKRSEAWLNTWGPRVKATKTSKRETALDLFRRASGKVMCGKETDASRLKKRIELVAEAYGKIGKWENPLKDLDVDMPDVEEDKDVTPDDPEDVEMEDAF
ncbi:hypothetical protein K469DRAFT_754198 [Zopfia rhizophila CBS 207.26]|uniref:Uncharacterized protein n=1 Tax=Zopfia rhizophila CBS 207.26 TaxID=1314779 RepID=A0A6A6DKG8_9PEZI|nr:hypothetical protein K469DRAFT_754198 [Zopfia rhizophila CBS 207.26]